MVGFLLWRLAFSKLLSCVINNLFFFLVHIVRDGLIIKYVEIGLYFGEDVVGILIIKLCHGVRRLAKCVFGFEHEVVEVLIDFVLG